MRPKHERNNSGQMGALQNERDYLCTLETRSKDKLIVFSSSTTSPLNQLLSSQHPGGGLMKDLPITLPPTQTSSDTLAKEIVNNSSNVFHRKYSLKGISTVATPQTFFNNTISNVNTPFSSNGTAYLSPIPVSSESVNSILKKLVVNAAYHSRLGDADVDDAENAFFVADLGDIARQYYQWRSMLSRVEPFYAVKCNPDPTIVKTLVSLGASFDCASKAEIQTVLDMGVDPSRIIYANPCKQTSFIRWAAARGVTMMTFDNADELLKIKGVHPNAKVVLRILTDDSHSVCKLGTKFGASQAVVPSLLTTCRNLGADLVGVSFHVGSGCGSARAFSDAVALARSVFDLAEDFGFNLTLLDIGGGFPGRVTSGVTFAEIAAVLRPALDTYFPADMGVRIIAEPAVDSAVPNADRMLVDENVNPNAVVDETPSFMYYVNDGVYGSFNCLMFDHAIVTPRLLLRDGAYVYGTDLKDEVYRKYSCSIWGPTCDSIDCISKDAFLPQLNIGDWLCFENMGAYTMCAASTFNGFAKSKILYTNTEN
ncbi:hypothetical protein SeMB42_g00109 [Synchytrium endobioticum]|uniref:ornithine decarboxylase n=1 Tax=Synchytrium endobioticum TaxID=286115 RepID=A0A507DTW3_9FUNG|nr:hypothetical protein SeMB42_g00109 [Synchytrium endobioticum]